jgi:hypothetical protein
MALLLLYMCPHRVDGAAQYAEAFTTAMYGFTTAVCVLILYVCPRTCDRGDGEGVCDADY